MGEVRNIPASRDGEASAQIIPECEAVLGASATSAATGKAERTARLASARGEALGPSLADIVGTSLDSGVELDALARKPAAERAEMMGAPDRPTALICGNDVVAIGAMDAAIKIGLAVPQDLSIIGVDDIPMASWSMISLTTVRQSISEIGMLAARRVAKQIEIGGNHAIARDILPTSLVRRSTTDRPNKRAD